MSPVIDRILNLVDKCELNEKQILSKLEISNGSTISDWRSGKSKSPSIQNIIKFANFFNVSTDYLLMGEKNLNELTEAEKEWLHLYQQLSEHNKIECTGFVKGYITAQGKTSSQLDNNNKTVKS